MPAFLLDQLVLQVPIAAAIDSRTTSATSGVIFHAEQPFIGIAGDGLDPASGFVLMTLRFSIKAIGSPFRGLPLCYQQPGTSGEAIRSDSL